MWFLFGEVFSSSGCLGWATFFLLWHSLSLPYNYFPLFLFQNWGVIGSVGDRVVIAMIGGNGEKPTLRIVKAADLHRHLRNKQQVLLPREEIIYTTGN